MPLSTRSAVALGMFCLSTIGVATVFGNTILALVAPAAEVTAGGPRPGAPSAAPGAPRGGPAAPVDTARSGPAIPPSPTVPSAGAKDASS